MAALTLPDAIHAPDPSADPREWLPAPAALVDALAAQWEPLDAWEPHFEQMGVPSLDLSVTPLSARVGAMAAAQGLGFYHHERRGRLPVPPTQQPERKVWEEELLPVWEHGVLTEPKYFSFFLETPFAPYNPNYRRKWRAHELLHGLIGSFWHPEMSRFHCYLGARLDELLPVVHWYHLDEVFRHRCRRHLGASFAQGLCHICEAEAVPYWTLTGTQKESLQCLAAERIEQAWEHFAEEWKVCWREWESGRRIESPRGHINGSSDAVGYMVSHWPRLTSWGFGTWAEMFLVDGVDRHAHIPAFMGAITQTLSQMVSGTVSYDPQRSHILRMRRALLDVSARCFQALEWLEDGSRQAQQAEDALMPVLEQASEWSNAAIRTEETPELATCAALFDELCSLMKALAPRCASWPRSLVHHFPMFGYQWHAAGATGLTDEQQEAQVVSATALVQQGVESAVSASWEHEDGPSRLKKLDWVAFLKSDAFRAPGRLLSRLATWVSHDTEADSLWQGWLAFDGWLFAEPRKDEEAELFAVVPTSPEELLSRPGTLRLHDTYREVTLPALIAGEVLGEEITAADGAEVSLACVIHEGEPGLSWLTPEMTQVFVAVREERPLVDWLHPALFETVTTLLEHAFLVWLPLPASFHDSV